MRYMDNITGKEYKRELEREREIERERENVE